MKIVGHIWFALKFLDNKKNRQGNVAKSLTQIMNIWDLLYCSLYFCVYWKIVHDKKTIQTQKKTGEREECDPYTEIVIFLFFIPLGFVVHSTLGSGGSKSKCMDQSESVWNTWHIYSLNLCPLTRMSVKKTKIPFE